MSSPLIPSRSFSPSLSMESPEAVSSVFLPLPPEPPDPDLDVMLLVDHPVPPVPPHPPPILIDASVLFVQPLLMHPLLAEADLSSSLTTRRVSLLHPVSKPRNLVSCGEHVSFKSSLRKVPYYQQEAGVIEISVARFLGLLTADCKFTRHFKFSRTGLRMLKFWRCSQSKHILHLKPWSHVVGPISPCFMLSQGMVFISYWSESFLFDHCLREEFNYLSRRSLFPCKQEIMLFLNGSLPRIEDFPPQLSRLSTATLCRKPPSQTFQPEVSSAFGILMLREADSRSYLISEVSACSSVSKPRASPPLMSLPCIPSRSFFPSLSMESPEAVSSGFLPLPPEPPEPDLDVMLLVDSPVPPVPPRPSSSPRPSTYSHRCECAICPASVDASVTG
ncbi:hypothetical protein F2Q68_00020335 [Brassica cretica]|uniref:Uncharacterized protein n=1 Tax=Brassica cretica TaxID=69181 RepID=A0A8S9FYW5_BRACR|nr:hypothetical protein F2Q68_00020335 [Brassica cretica]